MHGNDLFSIKSETGKIYRKQILIQIIYGFSVLLGYFIVAALILYLGGRFN